MLTIWFTLPHKLTNCVCRPGKAFMPLSGNFARGAALAGPTNHHWPDKAFMPPSGNLPGALRLPGLQTITGRVRRLRRHPAIFARGAALAGPTNHRRPDKAFTPPSGNFARGAALTGPTNHHRPGKAFTPPSGNFARGATLAGPTNHRLPILSRIVRAIFAPDHRNFSCLR